MNHVCEPQSRTDENEELVCRCLNVISTEENAGLSCPQCYKTIEPDKSEILVCRCYQVTELEVVSAIKRHNLQTMCEVRQRTCAGRGCNACHRKIRQYIEEVHYSDSSPAPICSAK